MIQITVYRDKDWYTGFCMRGHAGYAESGSDIVCSAVSVLAINTCNAIEAFTDERFSLETGEEDGIMLFSLEGSPGHDAQLLMNTMVLGLQDIADSYGAFIHFDIEEV